MDQATRNCRQETAENRVAVRLSSMTFNSPPQPAHCYVEVRRNVTKSVVSFFQLVKRESGPLAAEIKNICSAPQEPPAAEDSAYKNWVVSLLWAAFLSLRLYVFADLQRSRLTMLIKKRALATMRVSPSEKLRPGNTPR